MITQKTLVAITQLVRLFGRRRIISYDNDISQMVEYRNLKFDM